jgi:phosphate transport system substrate-binding protein
MTEIAPNRQSFESASANADWTKTPAFYVLPTDEPGKESWPISGTTFILLYKQQQNAKVANGMLKFFDWAYRKGTRIAEDLDYVEMPRPVVELVESSWIAIKSPGGNAAWTASAVTQH